MSRYIIIVIIMIASMAMGSLAWYLVGKKSQIPQGSGVQFHSVDDFIPSIPEGYQGSGDPMQDFLDLQEEKND